MKKRLFITIAVIISSFLAASCSFFSYDLSEAFYRLMKVERRATTIKKITDDPLINSIKADEEYDVLIITDLHFGNENQKKNGPRREKEWLEHIQAPDENGVRIIDSVRFVICMGDVADHGLNAEFKAYDDTLQKKLLEIKTAKAPDGIKVFNILGNHDLYNTGWDDWIVYCEPYTSYYKFDTPSFSWYFLDSASGTLGRYQYDTFNEEMKNSNKKNIVFSHVPIYAEDIRFFTMQNTEERNKIISTCGKYQTQAFLDGHTHEEHVSDLGKFTEYNIPGFLEVYGYGILHVNEALQEYSVTVKYY